MGDKIYPDLVLKLGDFEFQDYEIPEEISVGGEQHLSVHDLIGGKRIVNTLGKKDHPITWHGLLYGSLAEQRAKYLEYLRNQGKPLSLSWSPTFSYTVVIQEFNFKFQRFYKIPYSITLIVVDDLSNPVVEVPTKNVYQVMDEDVNTASDAADSLTETTEVPASSIQTAIANVKTAIAAVRKYQATVKEIKNKIQDAQKIVNTAIASVNNTIQDITTLGGIFPNNSVSVNANKMSAQVARFNNSVQLNNVHYQLEKTNKNTNYISTPTPTVRQITVINADLYQVAQQQYGDATLWTVIAKANGLTDPKVTGQKTLIIPPKPSASESTGGVLAA